MSSVPDSITDLFKEFEAVRYDRAKANVIAKEFHDRVVKNDFPTEGWIPLRLNSITVDVFEECAKPGEPCIDNVISLLWCLSNKSLFKDRSVAERRIIPNLFNMLAIHADSYKVQSYGIPLLYTLVCKLKCDVNKKSLIMYTSNAVCTVRKYAEDERAKYSSRIIMQFTVYMLNLVFQRIIFDDYCDDFFEILSYIVADSLPVLCKSNDFETIDYACQVVRVILDTVTFNPDKSCYRAVSGALEKFSDASVELVPSLKDLLLSFLTRSVKDQSFNGKGILSPKAESVLREAAKKGCKTCHSCVFFLNGNMKMQVTKLVSIFVDNVTSKKRGDLVKKSLTDILDIMREGDSVVLSLFNEHLDIIRDSLLILIASPSTPTDILCASIDFFRCSNQSFDVAKDKKVKVLVKQCLQRSYQNIEVVCHCLHFLLTEKDSDAIGDVDIVTAIAKTMLEVEESTMKWFSILVGFAESVIKYILKNSVSDRVQIAMRVVYLVESSLKVFDKFSKTLPSPGSLCKLVGFCYRRVCTDAPFVRFFASMYKLVLVTLQDRQDGKSVICRRSAANLLKSVLTEDLKPGAPKKTVIQVFSSDDYSYLCKDDLKDDAHAILKECCDMIKPFAEELKRGANAGDRHRGGRTRSPSPVKRRGPSPVPGRQRLTSSRDDTVLPDVVIVVIDTCAYIKCMDEIEKLVHDPRVLLKVPHMVTEELDKLKERIDRVDGKDCSSQARTAIRKINIWANQGSRVQMQTIGESLRPEDYGKPSPDDLIIAAAYYYAQNLPNPVVLVTEDVNMQNSAKYYKLNTCFMKHAFRYVGDLYKPPRDER